MWVIRNKNGQVYGFKEKPDQNNKGEWVKQGTLDSCFLSYDFFINDENFGKGTIKEDKPVEIDLMFCRK